MGKQALPGPMNICLMARKFPIRGRAAENSFLWPIAKGLSQKGHNVVVISSGSATTEPEVFLDGVRIFFLNDQSKNGIQFARAARMKFSELHRKQPFHLLHSLDSTGLLIAKYKKDFRISVAYDVRATQLSQLFAIQGMAQETVGSLLQTAFALSYKYLRTYVFGGDRRILKSADGIFVSSPQERLVLERYYFYPDAKTHSVPYGIEVGDLAPRESSQRIRAQYQIPDEAKVAVTVTDMTEVGDHKSLLDAFEKVAIKKSNARLMMIGNGPKRKEIEAIIYNLALGGRVILTGAVPSEQIPEMISVADVFVNTSGRTTGFEPSLLEAMAQEKVIIGSEVSAISSLVEDGIDGFLVRPADILTLSNLLLDVFNEVLPVQEIGGRARRKVVDFFDLHKMVESTLKAYSTILHQTGRAKELTT